MISLGAGVVTAIWLGILTSVSPCPLATNVAAVSYVGRRVDRPSLAALSGGLYALGRALAYVAVAAVVTTSLLAAPRLSHALQTVLPKVLGPLLILVGVVLLELVPLPVLGRGPGEGLTKRAEALGVAGALLLGAIFALSFCPISAALFFGSLLPLAIETRSAVLLPAAYGLGTALPVVGVALLLALGVGRAAASLRKLERFAHYARVASGVVFVVVGVLLSLSRVFHLF